MFRILALLSLYTLLAVNSVYSDSKPSKPIKVINKFDTSIHRGFGGHHSSFKDEEPDFIDDGFGDNNDESEDLSPGRRGIDSTDGHKLRDVTEFLDSENESLDDGLELRSDVTAKEDTQSTAADTEVKETVTDSKESVNTDSIVKEVSEDGYGDDDGLYDDDIDILDDLSEENDVTEDEAESETDYVIIIEVTDNGDGEETIVEEVIEGEVENGDNIIDAVEGEIEWIDERDDKDGESVGEGEEGPWTDPEDALGDWDGDEGDQGDSSGADGQWDGDISENDSKDQLREGSANETADYDYMSSETLTSNSATETLGAEPTVSSLIY